MFTAVTDRILPPDYDSNPTQLNYGVAVTDVDQDGDFEIVVAGWVLWTILGIASCMGNGIIACKEGVLFGWEID